MLKDIKVVTPKAGPKIRIDLYIDDLLIESNTATDAVRLMTRGGGDSTRICDIDKEVSKYLF